MNISSNMMATTANEARINESAIQMTTTAVIQKITKNFNFISAIASENIWLIGKLSFTLLNGFEFQSRSDSNFFKAIFKCVH